MIQYNPKDWFTFIFRLHKADTFRQLAPLMFFIAVYCAAVGYIELRFLNLSDNSYVKNVSLLHTLLGVSTFNVISFQNQYCL
jgi:ion channel-forming bestrophin family protein